MSFQKGVSLHKASKELDVSYSTLRKWAREGKIATSTLPNGRLILSQKALSGLKESLIGEKLPK